MNSNKNAEFEVLLGLIVNKTGINESEISSAVGHNSGYIAQIRSRMKQGKEVSDKFLNLLRLHFAINDNSKIDFNQTQNDNVINEPDIPLLKDKNIDDSTRNEKSLHVMIENSLELNIAHKNVTATNLKLTAMLETLIMGNSNSGSLPNISPILAPYLDLIAAGGVGKFWKDKSAGKVELGKILNAQKEKNSELHMK